MDFLYDDEQDALREAVKGLVGKAYGDYENRRQAVNDDPGFDEKLWAKMAEMGLLGLPFSEEDGGVGAGPVEIGIVCQELGRVIAPEPYLTSVVLAGGLVSACGTPEQRQEILGALSAGESVLAFAHDEPGRGWTPSRRAGHRDPGRRRLDAHRASRSRCRTAPAPTCSSSAPPSRRRHRAVRGGRRRRRPHRLPDVRRHAGRTRRLRRHRGHAAGRARARRHQQHLDGPGHHPGDGGQPGPRRHAVPAADHDRVPPQPQAVRRPARAPSRR